MSITRTQLRFETQFVQVPNAWVRDRRLSRKARGLLVEIMSHSVGWEITLTSLVGAGSEGRDSLRGAIAELEKYGYLRRDVRKTTGGKFDGVDYIIQDPHEEPGEAPQPSSGNPTLENDPPMSGNPTTVEPTSEDEHQRTLSLQNNNSQKGGEDTVPSPAPALSNEREDPWTDLVGGSSNLPSVAKGRPDRCEFHAFIVGNVGPCAACKTAREKHEEHQREIQREAHREHERQQAAAVAERQARIEECELCDAFGYLEGRPCHHDPELQERNRRGAELVRKSLAKK